MEAAIIFLFEWLALPAARNRGSFRAFLAGASAQHALHSAVVRVQRQKYLKKKKAHFWYFEFRKYFVGLRFGSAFSQFFADWLAHNIGGVCFRYFL